MFKEYYRKKKSAECEETLTERNEDAAEREENLAVAGKESKPKVAMVPLFSWRTIIVVAIGLILGVGLGLGYWIISPSLGSSGQSATDEGGGLGLAGLIGISSVESYESRVRVQVVNPGLDYIPLSNLRQKGEYYTIKANSLPFFSFLSQE